MIPIIRGEDVEDVGKPRASGDDPTIAAAIGAASL